MPAHERTLEEEVKPVRDGDGHRYSYEKLERERRAAGHLPTVQREGEHRQQRVVD